MSTRRAAGELMSLLDLHIMIYILVQVILLTFFYYHRYLFLVSTLLIFSQTKSTNNE